MSGKASGFICWRHPVDRNKKVRRSVKSLIMGKDYKEIIFGSNRGKLDNF
jgi:hypothetical protein